ncbi:MAG: class I SAM-dependent methyltransferase [Acetobacteraceae bacterium]|nr:class I SAM-dependent methyltransferase [Acetobacteraceae bacterium]
MESAEYALMDEAEDHMWWYRALHARMVQAVAGVHGRVLDAGCGTGGLLAALGRLRPDLALAGLEWDGAAAKRAARKSGAAVVQGSVNTLPFQDGCFDAALAADLLCHGAVEPVPALGELRRVLRPGGRLVVNMPAYAWLLSAHDRRVHNTRRQSARQLRATLQSGGFAPVRTAYWNGLLLPLMVAQRKLRSRRHDSASDVAAFPPRLDFMLHCVTELERRLPFGLPAGGSVLALAIRR